MENINDIQNSILSKLGIDKEDKSPKKELGQEQFLELLVAQMSHQNPLEPQTNGEFITQLAQFGTVNGVQKTNETLASLNTALQSNQALQATTLVGREVLISSAKGVIENAGTLQGNVELPAGVQNLKLSIFNQQGELVRQIDMGTQNRGNIDFSWDGVMTNGQQANPGAYTVRAEGLMGETTKQFATNILSNVDSVTMASSGASNGSGLQLNLRGLDPVGLEAVKQIK